MKKWIAGIGLLVLMVFLFLRDWSPAPTSQSVTLEDETSQSLPSSVEDPSEEISRVVPSESETPPSQSESLTWLTDLEDEGKRLSDDVVTTQVKDGWKIHFKISDNLFSRQGIQEGQVLGADFFRKTFENDLEVTRFIEILQDLEDRSGQD